MFFLIGIIIGLVLGLTGSGGYVFAVPLLSLLGGVSMQQAVSTSLVVISVISTIGFISYLVFNQGADNGLSYTVMGWLMTGGISGMYLGQLLTKKNRQCPPAKRLCHRFVSNGCYHDHLSFLLELKP